MIIIGDLHLKEKEPYLKAQEDFLNFIDKTFPNEVLIFLGDEFDTSSPTWKVYSIFSNFLKNRKKEVHILGGNHTYSRRKGSLLNGLQHIQNVHIYLDITEVIIEGKECLMLPFKYQDKNLYIEQLQEFKNKYDLIFTHLMPKKFEFYDEGFEFSIGGSYFHGHHHVSGDFSDNGNSHYVVGVPTPTRHGEHLHQHRIFQIQDNKFEEIKVKQSFTFETIEYGEEPTNKNNILNIINAPSLQSVFERYKDYHIRTAGIEYAKQDNNIIDFNFKEDSIQSYYITFCQENNVPEEIININLKYLEES